MQSLAAALSWLSPSRRAVARFGPITGGRIAMRYRTRCAVRAGPGRMRRTPCSEQQATHQRNQERASERRAMRSARACRRTRSRSASLRPNMAEADGARPERFRIGETDNCVSQGEEKSPRPRWVRPASSTVNPAADALISAPAPPAMATSSTTAPAARCRAVSKSALGAHNQNKTRLAVGF
jgi:hypothetical protein